MNHCNFPNILPFAMHCIFTGTVRTNAIVIDLALQHPQVHRDLSDVTKYLPFFFSYPKRCSEQRFHHPPNKECF